MCATTATTSTNRRTCKPRLARSYLQGRWSIVSHVAAPPPHPRRNSFQQSELHSANRRCKLPRYEAHCRCLLEKEKEKTRYWWMIMAHSRFLTSLMKQPKKSMPDEPPPPQLKKRVNVPPSADPRPAKEAYLSPPARTRQLCKRCQPHEATKHRGLRKLHVKGETTCNVTCVSYWGRSDKHTCAGVLVKKSQVCSSGCCVCWGRDGKCSKVASATGPSKQIETATRWRSCHCGLRWGIERVADQHTIVARRHGACSEGIGKQHTIISTRACRECEVQAESTQRPNPNT